MFDGRIKAREVRGPLGAVDPLFYNGLAAFVARWISTA